MRDLPPGFFHVAQPDRAGMVELVADRPGIGLRAGEPTRGRPTPARRRTRPATSVPAPLHRKPRPAGPSSKSARSLNVNCRGPQFFGQGAVAAGQVVEDLHAHAAVGGLQDSGHGLQPGHAAALHLSTCCESLDRRASSTSLKDFRIGLLQIDQPMDRLPPARSPAAAPARPRPAAASRCESTSAIVCGRSLPSTRTSFSASVS